MSSDSPSPDAARAAATHPAWLAELPAGDFARALWLSLCRHSSWHPQAIEHLNPLLNGLISTDPEHLLRADHPWPQLLGTLHGLVAGYQPELGRNADRQLQEIAAALGEHPLARADDWAQACSTLRNLATGIQSRQQRIEQRLVDSAYGQWRSQRARQQVAQLLNRSMAGRQLPPDLAEWLQTEWFNELQWCLLHHGDTGSAWQRRADATVKLIASLQPPGEDAAARQTLYSLIPEASAELRALLAERAHSGSAVDDALARIEAQHLLLLKGRKPAAQPFKLISVDSLWFADISLSRELLARIEELEVGQWFVLREAQDQRVKLILKQPEGGELLFVNQLGIKALQISTEEFAYRLGADVAAALPSDDFWRAALAETLQALGARADSDAAVRAEKAAALNRQRDEVRQRVEHDARQRAIARAKAAAEAKQLAEEQARSEAAVAQQIAAEEQRLRDQEQARRRELQARQAGDDAHRLRATRLQVATLVIGQWIEFHDETGQLQWLKLAVKLQTSGKLIFVDREGIRRADLNRDQLVERLLAGSARITEQGPHFEDSLSRVVDGLRRDRGNGSGT